MSKELRLGRLHAGDVRGNELIAVPPHGHAAWIDRDSVKRGRILLGTGPKQRCSVAEITRTGDDHPDKHGETGHSYAAERKETITAHQHRRLGVLYVGQRVGGQQFHERIFLPRSLLISHQALPQPGAGELGMTHCLGFG